MRPFLFGRRIQCFSVPSDFAFRPTWRRELLVDGVQRWTVPGGHLSDLRIGSGLKWIDTSDRRSFTDP